MEEAMRRLWIMLLVAAIVAAIAVPVGAAPSKCVDAPWLPGCASSDEDPPITVDSIGVHMDAEPVWVHEAADTLQYVVTLENTTATDIEGLVVEFTAAFLETETDVVVPANDTLVLRFSRGVGEFTDAARCLTFDAAECGLTASVEVYSGEALVGGDSVTTTLYPDPPCVFEYAWVDDDGDGISTLTGTRSEALSDLCIWTLPEYDGITKTGVWEITLRPTLPDPETRKPLGAWMDVRDGVPGNWCTLKTGDPWGFSDRWKAPYPPDPTLAGEVYLPGAEDYWDLGLDDGMCISGGAGGDYFKVGNPKSFYLRADGDVPVTVTVKWVSDIPPPTPAETP